MQGSVSTPAFSRPVLLIGREHMNRAVHGDVVAFEVFDEKDWKAPVDQVIDQEGTLLFTGSLSAH
jgi:exosome complex exonuclease DIS3/RRP44